MERREALRNVALLMGTALSATTFSVLFDSCTQTEKSADGTTKNLFSPDQETMITEIADTIVPDTTTPGAKVAGVGPFIAMMVRDCYPDDVQKLFVEGLENVDKVSEGKFQKTFVSLSPQERNLVLRDIADETIKTKKTDKENADREGERDDVSKNNNYPDKRKKEVESRSSVKNGKTYFFQLIRELTLLGYFTSEVGATKALAYLPIPGRYDACVDLKPGQKAWAL